MLRVAICDDQEVDREAVLSGEWATVSVTVAPDYALSQILFNGVAAP